MTSTIRVDNEYGQLREVILGRGVMRYPDTYVLPTSGQTDGLHIQEVLQARGITVYPLPFGKHMEDGGAVRCATHPLVRD